LKIGDERLVKKKGFEGDLLHLALPGFKGLRKKSS
jgi:hypothetical protein